MNTNQRLRLPTVPSVVEDLLLELVTGSPQSQGLLKSGQAFCIVVTGAAPTHINQDLAEGPRNLFGLAGN